MAARPGHAVIIDHLVPPMARADTYGDMAKLEQLLDEYATVAALDPDKLPALRAQIWRWSRPSACSRPRPAACGSHPTLRPWTSCARSTSTSKATSKRAQTGPPERFAGCPSGACLLGARLFAACLFGACLSGDTSGDMPGDVLVADLTASSLLGNVRRHKPHELHGLCPSFSVILPIFREARRLARRRTPPSGSANHV
jgi:CobN/Magnesium Chelatase